MMVGILLAFFYLLFPLGLLLAEKKSAFVRTIGPVLLCYAAGLALGNIPNVTLPEQPTKDFSEISIMLSIPLMLFAADIKQWLSRSLKTVLSFFYCVLSVLIAAVTSFYLFHDNLPYAAEQAGMMVGVYTGGAPNLAAIGLSLAVPDEIIGRLNSIDIVVSAIYLLFLMSIAPRVLAKIYKPFISENKGDQGIPTTEINKTSWFEWVIPIVPAIAMLASIAFLSKVLFNELKDAFIIISMSIGGILLSFVPSIRQLKKSNEIGEYLILVFCVTLGARSDFSTLTQNSGDTILFCLSIISITLVLHYLLAYLSGIDRDTLIITSVAGIFGPAFIGIIGSKLKNREIIPLGIATGVIGYAIANFLGYSLGVLLK